MADEVKLFRFYGSPMSTRVEIALKLKGVEYENIDEDLSNKSPLLLKYSPVNKKVPVLLHNGKPLAESVLIVEYIDETWKHNPILPQHPYDKALARFWAKFFDDKCMPGLLKCVMSRGQEQEEGIKESIECLKILEAELGDRKFFGGEEIGLVDIVANFLAFGFMIFQEVSGLEVLTDEKFPRLYKWTQEYVDHSVIKECLPARDYIAAYFTASLEASSN